MLNKVAYGYPAELIGEVMAFGSHKIPVQYEGIRGIGEMVFDIRIGKFYASGLSRYGDVDGTVGTLPKIPIYLDDLYKEIYVDIVRKTAKKHDIKLPDNDPNFIRSMYTFTNNRNILGPGFTEAGGPAKCKTCGDLNEYVSPFYYYECRKCRMMADWARSAKNKFKQLYKLANLYFSASQNESSLRFEREAAGYYSVWRGSELVAQVSRFKSEYGDYQWVVDMPSGNPWGTFDRFTDAKKAVEKQLYSLKSFAMDVAQARQILKVPEGASKVEIERAYKVKQHAIYMQTGQYQKVPVLDEARDSLMHELLKPKSVPETSQPEEGTEDAWDYITQPDKNVSIEDIYNDVITAGNLEYISGVYGGVSTKNIDEMIRAVDNGDRIYVKAIYSGDFCLIGRPGSFGDLYYIGRPSKKVSSDDFKKFLELFKQYVPGQNLKNIDDDLGKLEYKSIRLELIEYTPKTERSYNSKTPSRIIQTYKYKTLAEAANYIDYNFPYAPNITTSNPSYDIWYIIAENDGREQPIGLVKYDFIAARWYVVPASSLSSGFGPEKEDLNPYPSWAEFKKILDNK